MTRYDRYFFWVFFQSALLLVALLATVYVVIDVLLNLDEFQRFENVARDVTLYYAFNLPPVLYLLLPIIIVTSGLFALARIIRARELIVLQAAGISPRRALAALFAGALLLGLGGLAVREFALPPLNQAQRESPAGASEFRKGKRLTVRDDAGNSWYVRSYDLGRGTLSGVRILSRDGNTLVVAQDMNWAEARREWFTPKGEVHDLKALLDGNAGAPKVFNGKPPVGELLPADFGRRKRGFAGTPISDLWRDAQARPDFRELGLAANHELWHPLGGLLMLLVAAGLVLWRPAKSAVAGGLAVCAVLGYQICVFWFETLSTASAMSPAIGAALTPVIFSALAAMLWWRK
jgi:lipopolysaccharide export LptBFGC system permease protein LptF